LEVAINEDIRLPVTFSQHVALRRRDVRYAVFKEQAPHPGPA